VKQCGVHEISLILEDDAKVRTKYSFLLTVHSPPRFDTQIVKIFTVSINSRLEYSLPISE